jgi:hypothetical protein
MNDIITKAFKALEEIVDVKIEPVSRKPLKEAQEEEIAVLDEPENKTIKDLFIEAGAYVFTHDFEFEGKEYSLFFEALKNGESADIQFDEFDLENIEDVLVQVLDEERNFIAELEDLPTDKLEEAEGDKVEPLDVKVDDVVAAAEEVIVQGEEPAPVGEKLEEVKPEEHKKEETLQLTGFNEAASQSQFFPGEDGDLPAGEFVTKNNITDYKIQWDLNKGGYLVSWGMPVSEAKKEESVKPIKEDEDNDEPYLPKSVVIDGEVLVDDINELDEADLEEAITDWLDNEYGFLFKNYDFKVKDGKVFVTDIEWDTSESLKESQQFSLRDKDEMADAKELLDANKEEEQVEQIVDVNAETVDDLKKSYIGSTILQCPVCRTMIYKDPKDLVKPEGETAEGEKLYNKGEDCPHCGAKDGFELVGQVASLDVNPDQQPEPPMVEPVEGQPVEEKPAEEPKEEQSVEKIEPTAEERPAEEQVELTPESTEEENKEKKKPKVPLIQEEPVAESLEKDTTMSEKYQDVILEDFNESKFDRLVKKYLYEVYDNIKSYETTQGKVDDATNKIIIEGKVTFKSGNVKDTKFIFEAKEITKRGKIKFVGINETFTKKKAFTLVGSLEGTKLLSESLTYSYTVESKKVYGQVKNPTKI